MAPNRDGGGNLISPDKRVIRLRRMAAIGDVLMASAIAGKIKESGYPVVFQCHAMIQALLQYCPAVTRVEPTNLPYDVTLDQAYEKHPQRCTRHTQSLFYETARAQLLRLGIEIRPPTNLRPMLRAPEIHTPKKFERPWIGICPRSQYYQCRTVPDAVWIEVAKLLPGTKFWVGLHPAPEGFIDLKFRSVLSLVWGLADLDLMLSADTGPMHVASALGVPVVAIGQSSSPELHLSDQRDFITIEPKLDCLNCQKNLCPIDEHRPPCQDIDPDLIAAWAKAKLPNDRVSAVVPVFKPPADRLNACLSAVINQVSEVVVTVDRAGAIPTGALKHPRIQYVTSRESNIGYGRNVNFGARHTSGGWLLLLNDDCFLAPHTVETLLKLAKSDPKIGAVGHLLRFPDGRIQFGGRRRNPGQKGAEFVDRLKYHPTNPDPVECEILTGTSLLVRRKAFYDAAGFDEDFEMYCEDDALCMALRCQGWKCLYTPQAEAIHEEAASSRLRPDFQVMMRRSERTFAEKWGRYWDWNAQRFPLGNFGWRS